jgi:hypothetical protein
MKFPVQMCIAQSAGVNALRVIGPKRHLLAMENRLYRTADDESDKSRRNKGEMPTPTRVVFEICLALAGFLCVALIAQLVEIAIETR